MTIAAPKLGFLDRTVLKKNARAVSLQRGDEPLTYDVGMSDSSDLPKSPFTDRPQSLDTVFIVLVSRQGLHISLGGRAASYPWNSIASFERFQNTYTIGLTNGSAVMVTSSNTGPRAGFFEMIEALRGERAGT